MAILSLAITHAAGTGAGVRDAGQLEQLLHGAVLAVAAVDGDDRRVEPLVGQAPAEARVGVEHQRLVAEPPQRQLDARAAALRDGALQRAPAGQDGDAHQLLPSPAERAGQAGALAHDARRCGRCPR